MNPPQDERPAHPIGVDDYKALCRYRGMIAEVRPGRWMRVNPTDHTDPAQGGESYGLITDPVSPYDTGEFTAAEECIEIMRRVLGI